MLKKLWFLLPIFLLIPFIPTKANQEVEFTIEVNRVYSSGFLISTTVKMDGLEDFEGIPSEIFTYYGNWFEYNSEEDRYELDTDFFDGNIAGDPFTSIWWNDNTDVLTIMNDMGYMLVLRDNGTYEITDLLYEGESYSFNIDLFEKPVIPEVPIFELYDRTDTELWIEVINDNDFDVTFIYDFWPIMFEGLISSGILIDANDSIILYFDELPFDNESYIEGYFEDDTGSYFDSASNNEIFKTSTQAVVVELMYDDTQGDVEINGVSVPNGHVFFMYEGLEYTLEAIPNFGFIFTAHVLLPQPIIVPAIFVYDNPLVLTQNSAMGQNALLIESIFTADAYPGYQYFSFEFTDGFQDVSAEAPLDELFTRDRLLRAFIYIDGELVVSNGTGKILEYVFVDSGSGHNLNYFLLREVLPGDGSMAFFYGPSGNLNKGDIKHLEKFGDFTYPITLELYLPIEPSSAPTPTPTIPDTNIPTGFEGLMTSLGLWNTEGLILFAVLTLIVMNIGITMLSLNPIIIVFINLFVLGIFMFMGLFPFWVSASFLTVTTLFIILFMKGSTVYE